MAVKGRKPKPEEVRRNKTPARHDWTEVVDTPYEGPRPDLGRAPKATREWWAVISSMPHCILWTPADWQFAVDTARIHAAFSRGDSVRASELRIREKQMGTTFDALRDLRIRYVDEPLPEAEAGVPSIDDYRERLQG